MTEDGNSLYLLVAPSFYVYMLKRYNGKYVWESFKSMKSYLIRPKDSFDEAILSARKHGKVRRFTNTIEFAEALLLAVLKREGRL